MADRSVLLFDLGSVLVDVATPDHIERFYLRYMPEGRFRDMWSDPQLLADFQLGKMKAEEFGDRFVSEWKLKISARDFLKEFESWTKRLYPGAADLLKSLRPLYRLAALSNSNEVHWRRNNEVLGVAALFERAFSSHEIGLCKPDPKAYEYALSELEVGAGETTFFDDVDENVAAARDLGIDAHQVKGLEQLRSTVVKLKLL